MKLYRTRPQTVQVHFPEGEDFVVVQHADGEVEPMSREAFSARYEPVLDLRV